MTATQILSDLQLVNRAYQVLYALGDEAHTVRTLEPEEAQCLVGIVQDIQGGHAQTGLDITLLARMSPGMIAYVAKGEL